MDADHAPSPPGREVGVILTGLAIVLLVFTIWVGLVFQVGTQQCVVCSSRVCDGTAVCPGSVASLVPLGVALAAESLLVSLGLSARAFSGQIAPQKSDAKGPLATGRELFLHIAAPFLVFFGWALVVLGLVLPFDFFEFCHEACGYPWTPWVLTGYPLLLVIFGGMSLAAGAVLLAIISIHLWRGDQMRAQQTKLDPPMPI